MSSYVHLQVKSEYTLLSSTCRIEELVKQAAVDYDALALTDLNVMHGARKFYDACLRYGIQPIIGLEAEMICHETKGTVLLYAMDNRGYEDLLKVSSYLMSKATPLTAKQLLDMTGNRVIIVLPEASHPIASHIEAGDDEAANRSLSFWREHVHSDRLFAGVLPDTQASLHHHEQWRQLMKGHDVPLAATGNVTMLTREDERVKQLLTAVKTDRPIHDVNRYEWRDESYLFDPSEVNRRWPSDEEALHNVRHIQRSCDVQLDQIKTSLPVYRSGPDTVEFTLRNLVMTGAKKRYSEVTASVQERINKELHVIESMNYEDYFLIVWDFMDYARQKGILTGPGRGSAAGSIVAYCLFITDVDPIAYDLLFERFLNPERVSLPDIDIDFPDHRRDEVMRYVMSRYSEERTAQIVTFGTFGKRAALRDAAKALGVREALLERMLKFLPQQAQHLRAAREESKDLSALLEENEEAHSLYEFASAIEGLPRHTSLHAAGVVLSERPLQEVIPTMKNDQGITVTQLPMEDLEAFGLLKIDLLGLRNLTLLEHIQRAVKANAGVDIHPKEVPLDDALTYSLLQSAQTTGVFQFESAGMQRVLRKLKPNQFEDLVAVNALYRPGPMEQIDTFIRGKRNQQSVSYPHPALEAILSSTYGVMVYQEQVMSVAVTIAGYSLADADLLRRAVSKKNKEELEREEGRFIHGAKDQGFSETMAGQLFAWIVKFADYGFNRSHSVAYSFIAYQIAYFKANYPLAFYMSYLNTIGNDRTRLQRTIAEIKERGWKVYPLHSNKWL
ncbi:DNA polymerase III alpha subunit [Geomicrobium sp. JCM 19037]|uniref:DNA polymerase III subunit alpha n=1 Tax=Geomicrobium sp. JCM 19037 TaxID=1460634 RepID=UPI00045F26C2|nr:DNA polymerase III subunit alpha [Geomicrobium sp. JCM 19037]GAK02928.1 DNA polymerase III alpha subunit [Geomicrobium sp. JCM 19037]